MGAIFFDELTVAEALKEGPSRFSGSIVAPEGLLIELITDRTVGGWNDERVSFIGLSGFDWPNCGSNISPPQLARLERTSDVRCVPVKIAVESEEFEIKRESDTEDSHNHSDIDHAFDQSDPLPLVS